MARNVDTESDARLARLDPEVAALVRAATADAEQEKRSRKRTIVHEADRRPIELKLKLGPAALICLIGGVSSAIGALIVFNFGEADLLWLLVSQMPAAGLMSIAWRVQEQAKPRA